MPTFTVNPARTQSFGFSSSRDSVSANWKREYFVDVTDADPTTISAYDVVTATGIPIVNKTIYQLDDGTVIPYVVCSSKTAKQDPKKLSRWTVTAEFQSVGGRNGQTEESNAPISPPASITNITPKVVSELGEMRKTLFVDKANPPKMAWLTPALNRWKTPMEERIPTLTLKITQYESSITYEQMLERRFKVNATTYRSKVRYSWLIENVEATEVDVILSGGTTSAALVTYTVKYNPSLHGWKEDRALIDTQFRLSQQNRFVRRFRAIGHGEYGYITVKGERKQNQLGLPDYDQYETYEDIDFSTFLQV